MTHAVGARDGRNAWPRVVVVLLALAILVAGPLAAPAVVEGASLKDQIAATKKRQNSLNKSIDRQEALLKGLKSDQATTRGALADTTKQLDGINVDQARVRKQIDKAKAALDRASARLAVLVEDLRQTDFTLGLLKQELGSGEVDLKARRQALGQRLAEAYRAENTTLLEQVFTADSFSDALTETSAYLAYGDQDAVLAKQISDDQQALDTLRLLTTSTRLRTDQLRRETIETQNDIKARRDELNQAKRRLFRLEEKTERIKRAQQARYRVLVKNEKQARQIRNKQLAARRSLQNRIAGLVRQAQQQATQRGARLPTGGSGRFIWPTRGTVTQGYGCTGVGISPPRGSCPSFHSGIDIANAAGTPIRAAGDGVVAFIGFRTDGAFVVVIGHAGGYETMYAHMLATYPVRVGQFVKKGQLVGKMGSTGYSTGNHLHWEVSRGFSSVDPRSVV
ncbi:MAG: murein hydrolase activator EnvC [Chloroflexota bacterium]